MENPFIYGKATDSSHFTDREQETLRLKNNFECGINTIIVSPRRWGKTSLVNKVAEQLADRKDIRIVRIDAFPVRNVDDFYRIFSTEIIKQTSNKVEEWIEGAKTYLTSLVPVVTISTDPMNPVSVSLNGIDKKYHSDVLTLPERIAKDKGCKIIVCIDEFQQLGELPDSVTFQKQLRSVWQHQQLVSYCIYGSKRHLLMNMFSKYSMPFYKFGDIIYLERIPIEYWNEYIQIRFEKAGMTISQNHIADIYSYVEGNSSYMQQLSSLIWFRTQKNVNDDILTLAKNDLLNQNHALFLEQINNLSSYQINFLRAILYGHVNEVGRKEIIDKFNLGSSANVATIKKALQKKEIIEINGKEISFTDPIFIHWLKQNRQMLL